MELSKLAKAVTKVMAEVRGVEKNLTVGVGNSSYRGVADKDVKNAYNKAMCESGLCILPLEIKPKTHLEVWDEKTKYGIKKKMLVFTEVNTTYLLLHESGESQIISGYGHSVDSQDKGAGKATTYAMKYALLYAFMTPTGKIDDTDNHCSKGDKTEPDKPYKLKENLRKQLEAEITKSGSDKAKLKKFFKVDHIWQMSETQQAQAMKMIISKTKKLDETETIPADKFRDQILDAKDFNELGKLNDRAERLFKDDELNDMKSMIAARFQELQ